MKDITSHVSSKPSRNSFYFKKRPSPHGVAKSRRTPVSLALSTANCRVIGSAQHRVRVEMQRQRELQALTTARDTSLLEEEYRTEVLKYMHDMEQCTMSSATCMDQQPEIGWHMRPCLVDFLVEIHLVFKLRPETLYLTLNIIDRYCSRRIVFMKHYQLVGCAALWIAAKFEDAKERVPTVHDLHEICRKAYDLSAFIQMEHHVLTTIQWTVGHPTAEAWLRLACASWYTEDQQTGHVARFLMEITLFHREFVPYGASSISGGALILAQSICGKPRMRNEELESALEVAELLDQRLADHINEVSDVLVKKYSYAFYSKASTVVLQYYLGGGRFARFPIPDLFPVTPNRSYSSSLSGTPTPLSASTSCSSLSSDDMPATPSRTTYSHDPFVSVIVGNQKENNRPGNIHMEEVIAKRNSMDGGVDFARPVLQNLNGVSSSPRTTLH